MAIEVQGTVDPWKGLWRKGFWRSESPRRAHMRNWSNVMPLEGYRKKRDFRNTVEPKGRIRRSGHAQLFVVQKHQASHLHYDFRLAIEGLLVSWAVPKGPTLDPTSKRFATMTEDHPLEYAEFEGIIPEGEYGAGTVMVWDRGSYRLEEEIPAQDQLTRGEIKMFLEGQRLRGGFVMVHMGRAHGPSREKSRWLLIKRRDEYARPYWDPEDETFSRSVLTGCLLEEIQNFRPARKHAA